MEVVFVSRRAGKGDCGMGLGEGLETNSTRVVSSSELGEIGKRESSEEFKEELVLRFTSAHVATDEEMIHHIE